MPAQLSIPSAVVVYGEEQVVVYKIVCQWGSTAWRADHRYSEIREWHEDMKKTTCTSKSCGLAKVTGFPARYITSRANHHPKDIKERRLALEAHLRSYRGLCKRHQSKMDEFLTQRNCGLLDSRVADTTADGFVTSISRIEKSYWAVRVPERMNAFVDLQVQFFDHCMCTIRKGGEMELLLSAPTDTHPSKMSFEIQVYKRMVSQYFSSSSFPDGESVDKRLKKLHEVGAKDWGFDTALWAQKRSPKRQRREKAKLRGQGRSPLAALHDDFAPPTRALLERLWQLDDKILEQQDSNYLSASMPSPSESQRDEVTVRALEEAVTGPDGDTVQAALDRGKARQWSRGSGLPPNRAAALDFGRELIGLLAAGPGADGEFPADGAGDGAEGTPGRERQASAQPVPPGAIAGAAAAAAAPGGRQESVIPPGPTATIPACEPLQVPLLSPITPLRRQMPSGGGPDSPQLSPKGASQFGRPSAGSGSTLRSPTRERQQTAGTRARQWSRPASGVSGSGSGASGRSRSPLSLVVPASPGGPTSPECPATELSLVITPATPKPPPELRPPSSLFSLNAQCFCCGRSDAGSSMPSFALGSFPRTENGSKGSGSGANTGRSSASAAARAAVSGGRHADPSFSSSSNGATASSAAASSRRASEITESSSSDTSPTGSPSARQLTRPLGHDSFCGSAPRLLDTLVNGSMQRDKCCCAYRLLRFDGESLYLRAPKKSNQEASWVEIRKKMKKDKDRRAKAKGGARTRAGAMSPAEALEG